MSDKKRLTADLKPSYSRFNDLTGRVFAKLTVVEYYGLSGGKRLRPTWKCRCDCGREKIAQSHRLLNGECLQCDECRLSQVVETSRKHGMYGTGEYNAWVGMIQRCHNASHKDFPSYGGRGISVCQVWRSSFAAFLSDVGHRPTQRHSIDRIDVNGNYEPSNCRWASPRVQAANRRNNTLIEFNGIARHANDWARETGITASAIKGRLKLGWPVWRALSQPVRNNRRVCPIGERPEAGE